MAPNFPALLGSPRARWTIIGLHLLFLLGIYLQQGILSDKEALKYIGCAEDILQGDVTDILGNYLKYGAYVLFLLPFVALGVPELAVLAQIILGILAALALGRIAQRITGNAPAGNMAMALLLLCYPVQQWTLALYTESFFTSLSILFVERITREQRPDVWTIAWAVITVFARPVGMLFVGPAIVWKATGSTAPWWLQGLRGPGYVAVFLVAIGLPGIRAPQLKPIVDAHVIAGIADDPGAMAEFRGSSILAAQVFLLERHGAVEWSGLAVRRMVSLYTLPRPYYSSAHNLLIGVWMLLYPLAIWGSWSWRKHPQVRLVLVMLLLHTLLVGLTHDEWSGRFVVPLLPWLMMLALLPLGKSQQQSRV